MRNQHQCSTTAMWSAGRYSVPGQQVLYIHCGPVQISIKYKNSSAPMYAVWLINTQQQKQKCMQVELLWISRSFIFNPLNTTCCNYVTELCEFFLPLLFTRFEKFFSGLCSCAICFLPNHPSPTRALVNISISCEEVRAESIYQPFPGIF